MHRSMRRNELNIPRGWAYRERSHANAPLGTGASKIDLIFTGRVLGAAKERAP